MRTGARRMIGASTPGGSIPTAGTTTTPTVQRRRQRQRSGAATEDDGASARVLQRAVAWFADHGVTVERVLSANGSAYRSYAWRDACAELGIKHKRTRPYRPQTNGKLERFHRTLGEEWVYARFYDSNAHRHAELRRWLHHYNHHRPHSAIENKPPISRLTNVPGHHT